MSDRDQELSSKDSLDMIISKLCERCKEMASTFGLELDERRIERDIDEIQSGAVAACSLCLMAWREILDLQQQETKEKDALIQRIYYEPIKDFKKWRWFYFHIIHKDTISSTEQTTHKCIALGLHPLEGRNLQTAKLAARYEYPPTTEAESVAKLIESWHHQCTTQHLECASRVPSYQPPRVVEIRKNCFRLIVPSDGEMRGSYATLSHCWGIAPDFLKLTTTNIENLRQWNSANRLPQTFQDAARLCYRLHISYLWIDSLCILQEGEGSPEDWSLHVTEMRTIYSNGVLNIAASRAAAANEGMYTSRNPNFIRPAIIQGDKFPGLSNELHLLVQSRLTEPGSSQSPLNKRGWVFQERILSPRVVHFEKEQVFWECSVSTLSEIYPAGVNDCFGPGQVPPFELPTKQTCSGVAERWQTYDSLVEHYSSCQFTFSNKDKLAAFAGIAQHISCEFNDEYFAGMFRSQLPIALLWRAAEGCSKQDANQLDKYLPKPQCLFDNVYRCPSWSWAKLDADHTYCYYPFDPESLSKHCIAIHDVEATPVDSNNSFGNLKSASILLEGRLLPWATDFGMPNSMWNAFDGKKEACIDPKELYIIPFFAGNPKHTKEVYWIYFLIVHKPDTENQESYRRVGTATLSRHEGPNTDIEEHTKGLSTMDEIFEADVVWRDYLSVVEEKCILLI